MACSKLPRILAETLQFQGGKGTCSPYCPAVMGHGAEEMHARGPPSVSNLLPGPDTCYHSRSEYNTKALY